MNSITITIYWNPKSKATAQNDLREIVDLIENASNTEPKTIKNELGLIRAECTGLETVEGFGQ
jgi:hypothetical protein